MAQVIQDTTAGGRIGASFGNALSQGLQQLAQHKMNQLSQRNQARAYGLMNLPQNFAQGLAMLSPNEREAVLKTYVENYGLNFQPQEQQVQQSPAQMMQQPMAQQQPAMQQQASMESAMQALGMMPVNPFDAISKQVIGSQVPSVEQREMQALKQPAQTPEQNMGQQVLAQTKQPMTQQLLQQQNQAMQMQEPWEILQKKPIGKIQQDIYKEARKEQAEINKRLYPRVEKLEKAAEAAEKESPVFDNLRETIKSGKLTPAAQVRFRKTIDRNAKAIGGSLGGFLGLGVGALAGSALPGIGSLAGAIGGGSAGEKLGSAAAGFIPEFTGSEADQTFKKSVYGFFRNIKDWFGSQIPLGEANIFLETLPILEMDNNAKLTIIDQMEATGTLLREQNKAKKKIIKEHGGHIPANLFDLISERTQAAKDRFREETRKSIDRITKDQA